MLKEIRPRAVLNLKRLLGYFLRYTMEYKKKKVLFIIGCQRSGTTMLDQILKCSPQINAYGEDHVAFDQKYRLLPNGNIYYLIHHSKRLIVEFKPLNDTQHIDQLLKTHPNSKAIWIYRNFLDVSNSMVKKWGATQIRHLHQIAADQYTDRGSKAMGERISPINKELAAYLNGQDLSEFEAAAFIWLIRNSIYFEQELFGNPRVLLCKYEDLVTDPVYHFNKIFNFLGAGFSADYVANVRTTSIGKHEKPQIREDLTSFCEALQTRMDIQYLLNHRKLGLEI